MHTDIMLYGAMAAWGMVAGWIAHRFYVAILALDKVNKIIVKRRVQ
jgi:hypothetical protein